MTIRYLFEAAGKQAGGGDGQGLLRDRIEVGAKMDRAFYTDDPRLGDVQREMCEERPVKALCTGRADNDPDVCVSVTDPQQTGGANTGHAAAVHFAFIGDVAVTQTQNLKRSAKGTHLGRSGLATEPGGQNRADTSLMRHGGNVAVTHHTKQHAGRVLADKFG